MTTPDPDKLTSIREELRAMGYLDGSVRSFLTPDIPETSSLFRRAILVAGRVGLLVGLALGMTVTVSAAVTDPVLRQSARDIVLLAVYVTVLYGLLTAVIGAGGGASLAGILHFVPGSHERLGRRTGAASAAGVVMTVLALAYLLVWWRATIGSETGAALPVRIVLGAGAGVIALVFGRLLAWSIFVIIYEHIASTTGETPEPVSLHLPGVKRRLVWVSVMLVAAGGFAYSGERTVAAAAPTPDQLAPPDPTCITHPVYVLVLDGFGPKTLAAYEDALPAVQQLAQRAFTAPVTGFPGEIPPRVWTAVATGKPPARIGIRDYRARRLVGLTPGAGADAFGLTYAVNTIFPFVNLAEDVPLSSLQRTEKTVWEILAEQRYSVGVVNWWATWPASGIGDNPASFLVTDRFVTRLLANEPPTIADSMPLQRVAAAADAVRESYALDQVRGADEFLAELTLQLHAEQRTTFLTLYLPGMDILSRRVRRADPARDIAALRDYTRRAEEYAAFANDIIDTFVRRAFEDYGTVAVVLYGDPDGGETAGRVLWAGHGVRAQPATRPVSVLDIAPTVLRLLGLPEAEDMPGRVLTDAFHPLMPPCAVADPVPTYGARRLTGLASGSSSLDSEHLERLCNLGYIDCVTER